MKYICTRNFHTSFEQICLEDNVPVQNCHEKEAAPHGMPVKKYTSEKACVVVRSYERRSVYPCPQRLYL